MINTSFEVYKVVDPSLRDAKWADNCISSLRKLWRPIVNPISNRVNKELLFSTYDMSHTEAMFKDKGDFLKTKTLYPLPLLENIKNGLIEEIMKNPPKMELKANDATALSDKQFDMILLRLKSMQEGIINELNRKVGDPPEVIGNEKFRTNINEFYRMNLDPNDPEDVNFYEQNDFPKLKYEIAGQKLINIILKLNRFDEDTIEQFVIDILANKVICMDIYVDQITGEIKYDYIYPETFYGIFGKRNDGRDDICSGYEKSVTINEFLQKIGNGFDWDRDWRRLVWAINYRNGFTYTGFRRNNQVYDVCDNPDWCKEMGLQNQQSNICDWNIAYTYEVYLGKIQFTVPNVTAAYLKMKGESDIISEINYDYELTELQEKNGYEIETWYQQKVYESLYISTSGISQYIFNWGPCTYQTLHGANDEYARGTMKYYRGRGKSAVELAMPYIKLCNDAFYKMLWAVYEAHPDWEVYQVEEITELAKVMFSKVAEVGQNATKNVAQVKTQLTDIIKYFRNNLVKLKTIPRVDGKPYPNMNNVPVTEKRGLDPIAVAMQSVCMWGENQLKQKLGFNDLRWDGNIDNPRDGLGQNKLESEASQNNTGYIFRSIQFMKENVCTSTLLKSQDIIKFKDSLPYKWIRNLLGEEGFENLKLLDDFASHRYAMTIGNYNAQLERQMFVQLVNRSLDTGDGRSGLSAMQAGLLLADEDWKSGLRKLTYDNYKLAKVKRKQEMEMVKAQQDGQLALKKADYDLEKMKSDTDLQKTSMLVRGQVRVAEINTKGKIDKENMQNLNQPIKEDVKADAQVKVINAKSDAENQRSLI